MSPSCCFHFFSTTCIIVATGLLVCVYMPRHLLNGRLQKTHCKVFCSVASRWCRVAQLCYDVRRNIKPTDATCWHDPVIATFTNQGEADQFAVSCENEAISCFVDPDDRCAVYLGYANEAAPFYAGLAFNLASALFLAGAILYQICWKVK